MNERDDYEEHDTPPLPIDSPATLLLVFGKTIGLAALSLSAVLAFLLLWVVLARLVLH